MCTGMETDTGRTLITCQAFIHAVSFHLRSNPLRQRTLSLFTGEETET